MALCRRALALARRRLLQPRPVLLAQPAASRFWEPDKKGGYDTEEKRPLKQHIKQGIKELKPEVLKWRDEWIRNIRCDKVDEFLEVFHNDYEVVWKFDEKQAVEEWVVTTDRDAGEGKSRAEFVLGPNGTGLFRGAVDTTVPEDGIVKTAGYANIRAPTSMKSFKRPDPHNWSQFTHLLVKVRGDGRPYQLNLHMQREYDVTWNDQYTYPLFTRGGPYWQLSKIPFNKFYLAAKGRVQDKQEYVHRDRVSSLSLTLADGYSGPFQLEVDFVGVIYDDAHNDRFVYEMYEQGYLMSD